MIWLSDFAGWFSRVCIPLMVFMVGRGYGYFINKFVSLYTLNGIHGAVRMWFALLPNCEFVYL